MVETPTITLRPVESSNVDSVGYDPETRTFAVRYISGALYHYHDVESDVWEGCQGVVELNGSVGKYLAAALTKGSRYRYTRIE
jgi:hypothetical protein